MKIGIVSDIHCNLEGLKGALAAMDDVEELFCAGDAVYGFRWSNEVVDLLRGRKAHVVLGNHDSDFLKVHRERNGSNGYISPENYRFMTELPRSYQIELGGRKVHMVHASPDAPFFEYVYPQSDKFKQFGRLEADLFIYGHTHVSVVQQLDRVLVVNPGSAGEVRDPARPKLTYAVVDLASMEALIHDVAEDAPTTAPA